MKNSADLGGCYPPRPSALEDNTLLDLQNSSYPTQPHSIIANYYFMASSVSGQGESNPALWLATQASKMELHVSCWLRTTHHVPQGNFPQKPYNKSFIDKACLVKMTGCYHCSVFASLWTSTPFWSINTQKKNLAIDLTLGQNPF